MCQFAPAADLPARGDRVRYLKYIGPRFSHRFWTVAHVRTMQDLINRVLGQTRAQNTAEWRRIFANARARPAVKCVDHTTRHATRPWNQAWPNERQPGHANGISIPHQHNLDALQDQYYGPGNDGDYQYCVRRYNKCAWDSTRDYLIRQHVPGLGARIPLVLQRTNTGAGDWCRTSPDPWCLVPANRDEDDEDDDDSSFNLGLPAGLGLRELIRRRSPRAERQRRQNRSPSPRRQRRSRSPRRRILPLQAARKRSKKR